MASRGLVQRLAKSNNGYLASALVRRLEGRHSTPSNQLIRSFVTNGESSQTTTKNAETAQSSSLQHEIKKLRSELQSKFELVESKLKHSDDILEIKLEEVRQRMQSEIEATKLESLKFDTIIITTVAAAMGLFSWFIGSAARDWSHHRELTSSRGKETTDDYL